MTFITPNKAAVLIDGQWGSTGKGLLAAYLASRPENKVKVATTNASANAGHTTILPDGNKFVTFHLPTFAVMQSECFAYLNAGSIIDPELLMKELKSVNFNMKKLIIHPHASVIEEEDKSHEADKKSSNTKISSTQKGVGTALSRKIRREAKLAGEHPGLKGFCREVDLNQHTCVVEVPQGFDLSLNHGHRYPFVTSRDVTVSSAMGDAGLHPSRLGKICMSIRTYPIRVGNIKGTHGKDIGNSGPYYDDQKEVKWSDIGVPEEITTVTKRVRRVFTFSKDQYTKSLLAIRPDIVFVNFLNYLKTEDEMDRFTYMLQQCELNTGIVPSKLWGCGPRIDQVFNNYVMAKKYLLEEGIGDEQN